MKNYRNLAAAVSLASACTSQTDAEPEAAATTAATSPAKMPDTPATVAFAGDVMLGRGFNSLFREDPNYVVWHGTPGVLAGVDLLAFNLETTITDAEEKWEEKTFQFKMAPELSDAALGAIMSNNGVSIAFASTANNHTLDFLTQGALDTLEHLDRFGMPHAGSGTDATTAQAPALVQTALGARIAIFAASTGCSCGDVGLWNATANVPGAWMIAADDDQAWADAARAVREVAPEVDYVVFSLHWGPNYVET